MKKKLIKIWKNTVDKQSGILYFVLTVFSYIYYFLNYINKFITPKKSLKTKVISIGNITLGGSGKTPFVIEIVKNLKKNNISSAVLSRGYRSKRKMRPVIVDEKYCLNPEIAGDEPIIIYNKTKVPVGVYPDRYVSGKILIDKYKPDVFVLDDGFQHYKLNRDIDIVLIDLNTDPDKLSLFPAGYLRESLKELGRSDFVIGVKRDFTENKYFEKWARLLNKKIYIADYNIDGIYYQDKRIEKINGDIAGVCGIGHPEYFLKALEKLDIQLKELWIREDHTDYSKSDIAGLKDFIDKGYKIITTEKDFVKIEREISDVYILKIGMNIGGVIDEIVSKI